jgi:hypothetical protein
VLPVDRALRVLPADAVPKLDSTRDGEDAQQLLDEAARPFPHDLHDDFLATVWTVGDVMMKPDVIVFLDEWQNANTKEEVSIRASARAYAWDPTTRTVTCAADAIAYAPDPEELVERLESLIELGWSATAPRAR